MRNRMFVKETWHVCHVEGMLDKINDIFQGFGSLVSLGEEHPGTKIGAPPPDGVTRYDGGLIMLHLSNMRRSELYKQIFLDNDIKRNGAKYQFRGHLGEQDFFVLLGAEHYELFYIVPCQWNHS